MNAIARPGKLTADEKSEMRKRISAVAPNLDYDVQECCYAVGQECCYDYLIHLKIRDAAHGNTIVRRIGSLLTEAEILGLITEMQGETKKRASEVRARKRAERDINRS